MMSRAFTVASPRTPNALNNAQKASAAVIPSQRGSPPTRRLHALCQRTRFLAQHQCVLPREDFPPLSPCHSAQYPNMPSAPSCAAGTLPSHMPSSRAEDGERSTHAAADARTSSGEPLRRMRLRNPFVSARRRPACAPRTSQRTLPHRHLPCPWANSRIHISALAAASGVISPPQSTWSFPLPRQR